MNQNISFSKFKAICLPQEILERAVNKRMLLLYMRYLSIRITWFLCRFPKLTPNMITVLMIFWGPIASALILIPGIWGVIAFFLGFQLFGILDRIDGELARFKQQFNGAGKYLDRVSHAFINTTIFLAIGLKYYQITSDRNFIYLGGAAALLTVLKQYLYRIILSIALSKNKPDKSQFSKRKPYKNKLIQLARESIGSIEVSMINSLLLFIFIFTDNKYYFIPYIYFALYLFVIFSSLVTSVFASYKKFSIS